MPATANSESSSHRGPDRLLNPPITEVVCGLVFDSVVQLDLLELGVYWDSRRREYPVKMLKPTLFDAHALNVDPASLMPARAWLLKEIDGELVQQIQHDRFYMNWRRREGEYPHFNDSEAGDGLKTIALREFERLAEFCHRRGDYRHSACTEACRSVQD